MKQALRNFSLGAIACMMTVAAGAQSSKSIAITFDDLPVTNIGPNFSPGAQAKSVAIHAAIMAALRAHHVPAMGMVNEAKLHAGSTYDGAVNSDRVSILENWVSAGRTLGNHTFAHKHLSEETLDTAETELVEGEKISAPIMAKKGLKEHYYRYPFNDTGENEAKKKGFEAILAKHGYTIAPMTIQNDDWMYNIVYDTSVKPNADAAQKLRDAYLEETNRQIEFTEQLTDKLFHHQIPQVLLIHASQLNADTLDATLKAFEAHGYSFIDLPTALADKAYKTPDLYVGARGLSWLERWRIALLHEQPNFTETPLPATWVQNAYRAATTK